LTEAENVATSKEEIDLVLDEVREIFPLRQPNPENIALMATRIQQAIFALVQSQFIPLLRQLRSKQDS
jgi:hypothetical protein